MNLDDFRMQLSLAGQTEEEARDFIADFAAVRLRYIVDRLAAPDPESAGLPSAVANLDWSDPAKLRASGLDLAWLHAIEDPSLLYLHIDYALRTPHEDLTPYLKLAFLSEKERKALFPSLSTRRRGAVSPTAVAQEVLALNGILREVYDSGLPPEVFRDYQAHLGIHGALANATGMIGTAGATLAFIDAIRELRPASIEDIYPQALPDTVRSPQQIMRFADAGGVLPKAILLTNGRALAFPRNPDVVIYQLLDGRPTSAANAWRALNQRGRGDNIHTFAVGEVKTATDLHNLHERLGLAGRETTVEVQTRRFLMMSALTKSIVEGNDKRRTIISQQVGRFSDLFNLHFAWGYDDRRLLHPEHWDGFKRRVAEWCGFH